MGITPAIRSTMQAGITYKNATSGACVIGEIKTHTHEPERNMEHYKVQRWSKDITLQVAAPRF